MRSRSPAGSFSPAANSSSTHFSAMPRSLLDDPGRVRPIVLTSTQRPRGAIIYAMDARDRRRQGSSRVIRLHEDDGSFDRHFWQRISPRERLEAVWDLTLEYLAWKEPNGDQPRLQRSVCRLERRTG